MKHFLGIQELTADEITSLLGEAMLPHDPETLKGKIIATAFFEPSTRTRLSFAVAAHRLGADVINLSPLDSAGGESVLERCQNLAAMGADAIVVRCARYGEPRRLAEWLGSRCSVINAGDGANEHPSQALADMLTLKNWWQGDLRGRHVVIVGDIAHSRVAYSNSVGLTKLGARVTYCGPESMMPTPVPCNFTFDLDTALATADAVMVLRIQTERHCIGPAEYRERFGLTEKRASTLREGVPVLHPGPMCRDVEIDGKVADSPICIANLQIEAGVRVRKAILRRLLK